MCSIGHVDKYLRLLKLVKYIYWKLIKFTVTILPYSKFQFFIAQWVPQINLVQD